MVFRFGEHELDEELFELRHRGVKVAVQPKVLSLLFFLVNHRARAVTRKELLEAVWSDVVVGDASLSRAIVEARRAIGDEAQEVIVTVRGHGFRFAAGLTASPPPARPSPLTPAAFVGRDAHLAALMARLEQAFAGRSTIAWITGDAGMGKTRLAEEVLTLARSRGASVYSARCHEAPRTPPFWPWTQLLKAMGLPAPSLDARSGIDAFAEVTAAIVGRAAREPIVLFIDDLHWSDEASLSLLRFFGREARDSRVLVIGAYRDTSIDPEIARALGSSLREYGTVSIPLRGLTRDETARLVGELKGQAPPAKLIDALYERTGGCPLFVHQVLETEWATHALATEAKNLASSIDLQSGLIASIGRHLDGVSKECREVLVVAAVLGKDFDFAPLATAVSLSREELLDLLDEAARSRLLHKSKDARYKFVHPLIGEVLYKQLSASERATRHRAAAEALLAFHAGALDPHAARIAHHFFKAAPAGTAREALEFSVRAARHAELRGEGEAAVAAWQQAARALDFIPGSDATRLEVQIDLARSRSGAGDREGARDAYLDAALLARALGRPEALVEAALGFAELAAKGDSRRDALLAEAETALAKAPGDVRRLSERLRAAASA